MPISRFANDLVRILNQEPVPAGLQKEQELEQAFVLPIVERLVPEHTDVLVYVHPWRRTTLCTPVCAVLPPSGTGRVLGCPKCWEISKKKWASVGAFGTHHTFDLAAIDSAGEKLAVELKLSRPRQGRLPSGDVQRLLGQCALARTKHDLVVGYFVYEGNLDQRWQEDTGKASVWLEAQSIRLVFRSVSPLATG